MVTQSQGLISQTALESGVVLLRAAIDLFKARETKAEGCPTLKLVESPARVEPVEVSAQEAMLQSILVTVRKLDLALDAPTDIRYMQELNLELGNLVQSWKASGTANEKA